jgi:hypothetical protein
LLKTYNRHQKTNKELCVAGTGAAAESLIIFLTEAGAAYLMYRYRYHIFVVAKYEPKITSQSIPVPVQHTPIKEQIKKPKKPEKWNHYWFRFGKPGLCIRIRIG